MENKIIKREFGIEEAIEVARGDYNVGISTAIDKLQEYGFDVSPYWEKENTFYKEESDISIDDYDDKVIELRNQFYKDLGIDKLMEDAYNTMVYLPDLNEYYSLGGAIRWLIYFKNREGKEPTLTWVIKELASRRIYADDEEVTKIFNKENSYYKNKEGK